MTSGSTAKRRLVVTIDTEVDKSANWNVSPDASFDSVRRGIPEVLTPLFDEFGVVPTYLLSAEVFEDDECRDVLGGLAQCELGTHLHGDFVEPNRRLFVSNMAGDPAMAVQAEYPPQVEREKLRNLTDGFTAAFGYRPTSFRAGRFGLGPATLESLASLGYIVDSSVTPGLIWDYPQARIDFSDWDSSGRRIDTQHGCIVELPVGIRPKGVATRLTRGSSKSVRRGLRAIGRDGALDLWLRPSWGDAGQLIRYVTGSPDEVLVLMFHSMEIIPGASPYAATDADVARIVESMRGLFEFCAEEDIHFCSLSEAAAHV